MSETSPAVRAVWRSARQIRRYYENGGTKATVESNILPLIYELAPSIDFTEDESERLKGYPLEWTGRKSFKAALNRFRKEATKAGYPVPEASKNWILFNSEVPIHPARETRSGTAITIWSTSDTSAPSKSEGTPAPPASTSPSSTSSTSPPPPASTSSTSPPPPASTSPPSTSSPPAPPVRSSIENPPTQRGSNLPKGIWPLFDTLVPDVTASPGWRALQQECPLYGCDFADVKFRCEFRLKHEVNDDTARLLAFASDWIRICPEALDLLDGDCHGDNALKALIAAYRLQNPRKVPLRVERDSSSRSRLFSENPEQDRVGRGFVNHLREPYDGWDTIIFEEDPDDPESGEVEGKIKLAIAGWLDVALPSLKDETSHKERHILVRDDDTSRIFTW